MTRQEYLNRPLIKDVIFDIRDNRVLVQGPGTTFIQAHRREKVLLSTVEHQFLQLKKIAKNNRNVKLKGVSKFLPAVRKLYPGYCRAIDEMNDNFSQIVEISLKLNIDGIHMGCNEDALLKLADSKGYAISKLCYRNGEYSRYLDYCKKVKDSVEYLLQNNEDMMSYVISLA